MKEKEYVVSLNVSFTTPTDCKAKSEEEAEKICKNSFKSFFDKEFKNKLNDMVDFEIEIDYIEEQ